MYVTINNLNSVPLNSLSNLLVTITRYDSPKNWMFKNGQKLAIKKKLLKIVIFLPLAVFGEKMKIFSIVLTKKIASFGQYLTFKRQFSGASRTRSWTVTESYSYSWLEVNQAEISDVSIRANCSWKMLNVDFFLQKYIN